MQCPNCKMNIKDDAQFCIHCGTKFSTPVSVPVNQVQSAVPAQSSVCPNCQAPIQAGAQFCTNCGTALTTNQGAATATPDQILQQQQQVLINEQNEREKYLRAYFGSSYDRVMDASFSIGTFFFGWFWLLIYKLYSLAGKMFITEIGIGFVANIIGAFSKNLGSLFSSGAGIYLSVMYAREFSSAYVARANQEIDAILKTVSNEDERIKECKKAGGPSILGIIIAVAIVGLFVFIIFGGIFAASGSIDNSRKDTYVDTARAYTNVIKNAVAADEIKCGNVYSKLEAGVYYYSFTTASGSSASKILEQGGKSPWGNGNVSGQIIILKNVQGSYSRTEYAIVMVDEEGRGIGSFDNLGHPTEVVSELDLRRNSVKTNDSDNRKNFYNLTKLGDKASFEKTAPTLATSWSGTSIEAMLYNKGIESPKQPVACEIVAP